MKRRILALLLTALLIPGLLSACANTPKKATAEDTPTNKDVATPIEWTPVYNDHQCGLHVTKAWDGITSRELSQEEIASIVPAELLADMFAVGHAYIVREVKSVSLAVVNLKGQAHTATVVLGEDVMTGACCYSLETDAQKSACGDVEYALYQRTDAIGTTLMGHGEINGIPILVRVNTEDETADKPMLEKIVEHFARFKSSDLTLAGIKPELQ